MVRQATETAVSASISTPVGPVTLTVARTTQPGSLLSGVISSATFDSASGWHSGIRSAVRLAAMMPARRAVPSTSPFLALLDRFISGVALAMTTRPSATAVRSLAGFADTSTIRASPLASMWVRAGPPLGLRAMGSARGGGAGGVAARQQRPGPPRHVGLAHQAFADQEGRHADAGQPRQVGGGEDAAFAHHQPILWDQRRQRLAGRQRGFKVAQVTVIDADHRRAKFQGAIELGPFVDFDQDVHAMCQRR